MAYVVTTEYQRSLRKEWIRHAVLAAVVAMLLGLVVMHLDGSWWDYCYHDRFAEPPTHQPSATLLLHITEVFVIICLGASLWDAIFESLKVSLHVSF